MTDIKSQYQQWQVETNAAFTKCKADIEEIANYLLESKYNDLIAQYESSYDSELNERFVLETLQIFTYTKLLTYETNYYIRNGVTKYIKSLLQSNKKFQIEYDEILNHCISYFYNFDSPILDDSNNIAKIMLEILTLDDSNEYKTRLFANCNLVFTNTLDAVNLRILINSVIGQYDSYVIIPREDEAIKREHIKQEQLKKAAQARIKALDPNKNAECWDFSNFDVGQEFRGRYYKNDFIQSIVVSQTGKPPVKNGKTPTGNSQNAIIREAMRALDISECKADKTIIVLDKYDQLLERREVDGRSQERGIYIIHLKDIIQYIILEYGKNNEYTTTYAKLTKRVMELSLSIYYKLPSDYYCAVLPYDERDIIFVIDDNRDALYDIFRKAIRRTIDKMIDDELISREERLVAVKGHERITRDNCPDIHEKVNKAEKYAMSQIIYYNKKEKRNKRVTKKKELYPDKWGEFEAIYKGYINQRWDWDYTYEELYLYCKNSGEVAINFDEAIEKLNTTLQSQIQKRGDRRYQKYLKSAETAAIKAKSIETEYAAIGIDVDVSIDQYIDTPIIPEHYKEITNCFIDTAINKNNESITKNNITAWKRKVNN